MCNLSGRQSKKASHQHLSKSPSRLCPQCRGRPRRCQRRLAFAGEHAASRGLPVSGSGLRSYLTRNRPTQFLNAGSWGLSKPLIKLFYRCQHLNCVEIYLLALHCPYTVIFLIYVLLNSIDKLGQNDYSIYKENLLQHRASMTRCVRGRVMRRSVLLN